MNSHTSGFRKIAENVLLKKLMCRIISVSTMPGCTAFTVTPVPVREKLHYKCRAWIFSIAEKHPVWY